MSPRSLIALDFDGVVCDSAGETGTTGWIAARSLWPRDFADAPTDAYLADFRRVRPALETGYEAILLARLLRDAVPPAELLADAPRHCAAVTAAHALSRDALVTLFGATRDRLIHDDFEAWLELHAFYPGTIAAINAWVAAGHRVAVVTTKEQRFAEALCHHAGCDLAPTAIYGLEAGPKNGVLTDLLAAQPADTPAVFVEDRLPTLLKVHDAPALARYRLALADWGYLRPTDLADARTAHIPTLALTDFPPLADG